VKLGHEVDRERRIFAHRGFTAELRPGKLACMATRKRASSAKSARGKSPRTAGKLAPSRTQRGPTVAEIACGIDAPALAELAALIREAGGAPLGGYLEPLGARPILFASLPLAAVQPTPFQRDLSPTHAKRLAEKINETGAFLDPLIVVRGEEGRIWTPNGRHRLAAAKMLGLRQITALVSPEESLAYRILALNTEKAHNLKDKSLEVMRMARNLAKRDGGKHESEFTAQFEAAELLTLGLAYEKNPRFAGGAYSSFLKKVDRFLDRPLATSLRERSAWAARLQEIDTEVKRVIGALQARGFKSPYLRNYVVARINPVRFHKAKKGDTKPAMPIAQAFTRMAAAVKKFKVESVSNADLAWVAVGASAQD
jgi:ParB family transcriptional regulator, chromosome partitioning protein